MEIERRRRVQEALRAQEATRDAQPTQLSACLYRLMDITMGREVYCQVFLLLTYGIRAQKQYISLNDAWLNLRVAHVTTFSVAISTYLQALYIMCYASAGQNKPSATALFQTPQPSYFLRINYKCSIITFYLLNNYLLLCYTIIIVIMIPVNEDDYIYIQAFR